MSVLVEVVEFLTIELLIRPMLGVILPLLLVFEKFIYSKFSFQGYEGISLTRCYMTAVQLHYLFIEQNE